MVRFDHVSVVVEDLTKAEAFFLDLGFEREGTATVSGDVVDKVNGLTGVRAEIVMVRPPGGGAKLELVTYHSPADAGATGPQAFPPNRLGLRHICVEVPDLSGIVAKLAEQGYGTIGEVCDYESVFRLCYVRGPEGLIVELAERLSGGDASV